jgi:DNA-directed RNA polymerase subunit N (RpoN/RPB10)
MNCGKLIGDKYNYFQAKVRESRGSTEPICLDGKTVPKTVEAEIFQQLDIRRYCCKKTLLTHVDLIKKL